MSLLLPQVKVGDWFQSCAYTPEGEPLPWDSEEAKKVDPESRQMFMLVRETMFSLNQLETVVILVGSGDMGMNASDIVDYDCYEKDLVTKNPYHRRVKESDVPEDYRRAMRRYAGLSTD